MIKLDQYVFGYRTVKVSSDDRCKAIGILLRSGIPSNVSSDGNILISERYNSSLTELFSEKIEFSVSECKGVRGALLRIKYKWTVLIAILFSLFLSAVCSSVVWDIRVEGNTGLPEALVISKLEESGIGIGSVWKNCSLSDAETALLVSEPRISWVNINRRGTVCYVTLIENENNGEESEEETVGFANIVASRDCVIEEITVKRGVAAVAVGDSVKKGDLLISGVISTEEGSKFCRAEGVIMGRCSENIVARCDRVYTKTERIGEKKVSLSVKIFNFQTNIFKLYRNIDNECDIIEDVKTYSLFGKCKIPLEVYRESIPVYRETDETYSDSDLVNATSRLLEKRLADRLLVSDLLRIRTSGEFTEDGYTMRSDIVYLTDVGEESPFDKK